MIHLECLLVRQMHRREVGLYIDAGKKNPLHGFAGCTPKKGKSCAFAEIFQGFALLEKNVKIHSARRSMSVVIINISIL